MTKRTAPVQYRNGISPARRHRERICEDHHQVVGDEVLPGNRVADGYDVSGAEGAAPLERLDEGGPSLRVGVRDAFNVPAPAAGIRTFPRPPLGQVLPFGGRVAVRAPGGGQVLDPAGQLREPRVTSLGVVQELVEPGQHDLPGIQYLEASV